MQKICKLLTASILTIIFVFNSILSVSALRVSIYSDVSGNHWAYDAINYVTKSKYFNGYQDGTFQPSVTITRAEAVKVIVSILCRDRIYDTVSFTDVSVDDWFAPYVEAGKDLLPFTEGQRFFRPNELITREETIFALVRALRLTNKVSFVDVGALNNFSDFKNIHPEIAPYIAMALQLSIISGYEDGTIRADAPLTRAEFATLIYRAKRVEKGKDM